MPESTRLDQFRLALSYLERVEGEAAHWTKLRADKQLARTKYDEVRARYDQHLSRAKRAVDEMRRDAKLQIPAAESFIEAAKRDQKKLIKLAAKGGVDPRKLNESNRAVASRLGEASETLAELQSIVEAKSTGDLGGGVDLPLDEYPIRLDLLPAPPRLRAPRFTPLQSNLAAGAVMLALVLGAVGGIYLLRAAPDARFEISAADISGGYIEVRCENAGNRPLYLYAPWPNGRSAPLPGVSSDGNSWGILLHVRVAGETGFRLLEDADELWKIRGTFIRTGEPVTVDEGTRARLFLDLEKLRATGIGVESLQIECTKAGGIVEARQQVDQVGPGYENF